jgi:hypothetical protein
VSLKHRSTYVLTLEGFSTRRTFPGASHNDDAWGMNGDYS